MWARFRRLLHCLVADLAHYSGLLHLLSFYQRRILNKQEVCIIGLHRVLTEQEQARANSLEGMVLRERTFVSILEYLRQRFCVMALEPFLTEQEGKIDPKKPRCLITFDDGWADTYTTAYPWLKKFGMPAATFLATGLVGSRETFWIERLIWTWKNFPERREQIQSQVSKTVREQSSRDLEQIVEYLKHLSAVERNEILERILPAQAGSDGPGDGDRTLTWEQVSIMSRNGMDFGSHTVTHPLLPFEDDKTVELELRLSKQALEEKLAKRIRAFAYPNGEWDERSRQCVAQAGYDCAFTTRSRWYRRGQDRYTVSRILLHEGNVTGSTGQFSAAMLALTLAGWER
jgi:peptidoglycan/xylan/chitin deacetylase (PgdA/CDA1 family)